MNFSKKKLPLKDASQLRKCPVGSISPYVFMLAPIYVLLRRNEKFIAVKGPLDFFTPEELSRFQERELFFIPPFVDQVLPYRSAARQVRALLQWKPPQPSGGTVDLGMAPYEISDAILKKIGSLWGEGLALEPYFAAIFTNELCDLLPESLLQQARDQSIEKYERAVLQSGLAVFLALHLGYCHLPFLNQFRRQAFEEVIQSSGDFLNDGGEEAELFKLSGILLKRNQSIAPGLNQFLAEHPERLSRKLSSRLQRVKEKLIPKGSIAPTIYGAQGFMNE